MPRLQSLRGSLSFSTEKPDKCFTYGYGRAEDLTTLFIVFLILLGAAVAAFESSNVRHDLLHGVDYLSNAVVNVDSCGASGGIFLSVPGI